MQSCHIFFPLKVFTLTNTICKPELTNKSFRNSCFNCGFYSCATCLTCPDRFRGPDWEVRPGTKVNWSCCNTVTNTKKWSYHTHNQAVPNVFEKNIWTKIRTLFTPTWYNIYLVYSDLTKSFLMCTATVHACMGQFYFDQIFPSFEKQA